jgi:UDP-N-acetylmuramyl pentapeptide phosphotransferase/UDP-N-acetylglucosamine-1-phosphate transferase
MFAIGFWDDLAPLGARRKLTLQILIALAVCCAGIGIEKFQLPFIGRIIELRGWGILLTVLWLVGITNLLNLIDGVDGLAAGIALMLLALLVCVGVQNGTFVLLTAGMTGALLGFLWFNFPPARIYLGDGGAYFLGFQIGLYSLIGSQKGTVLAALLAPLFVLALPIVDTSLAIARRGLRGLPIFRPDRRHIHHHLLSMGLSRRQVVFSFYGLTLVFLAMGLAVLWSRGQLLPVLFGLAVLLLLLCAGRLSFSREWFAVGRTVGNSLAMRQEIQYGLSLMSWLRQEGRRCASMEALFSDLVFAARRLGFTCVKVRLRGGEGCWEERESGAADRTFSQELPGGELGRFELRAPACVGPSSCHFAAQDKALQGRCCPCAKDSKLFEIMAELVAEGWTQAVNNSPRGRGALGSAVPATRAAGGLWRRPPGQARTVRVSNKPWLSKTIQSGPDSEPI